MHESNPRPLSFPLFIFLSTSHARPHSVVTRLSLIMPLFLPSVLRDVTLVFVDPLSSSSSPSSSHLPILSDFISPLLLSVSFPSPHLPSIYSYITFPCPVFSLSICVLFSPPLSPAHYLPLSAARMSLLWPSCQLRAPPVHTDIHPAHICTSVCMPMTVWRSHPANPKHKDGRQGTTGER